MFKILARLLRIFETLDRRITVMDARVTALTSSVATLKANVDALVAKAGALDPDDAAGVVAAQTAVDALNAEVVAAIGPPVVAQPAA